MSKRDDKGFATLKGALGTAATCKVCVALMVYGVNSVEAMNEVAKLVGRPTYGNNWKKFLQEHADYHARRGEPMTAAFLPEMVTDEFQAAITEKPQPKPRVDRREAAALAYFEKLQGKVGENGRTDNRPVVSKLDAAPFAGFREAK